MPLDIALASNDYKWFEHLPKEIEDKIEHKIYYGHLLDHVMHQDYILKPGVDAHELKKKCLKFWMSVTLFIQPNTMLVIYIWAPALIKHYKKNDPTNSFNLALVNKQCLNIGANTKIKSLLKNNRYRHLSILMCTQKLDFLSK